jgi:hypothetical protein
MNIENTIVCAICLVSIGIVSYFMYTKYTAQNEEMLKLAKRCEAIEMLFARPPPPDDLRAMYKPRYTHNIQRPLNVYEQPMPKSPPCESAMCDLEPLRVENNEEEIDEIVNEEINKVIEEGKLKKKDKKLDKKNI